MAENIYSNEDIIFSHRGKRTGKCSYKAQDTDIYANTEFYESNGDQTCHPDPPPQPCTEDNSAPCRWWQVVLALLYLVLLCGLTALGALYVQRGNMSDLLGAENRNLSASLSSLEERLADVVERKMSVEAQNRNLSASLVSVREALADVVERKMSVEAQNRNLSASLVSVREALAGTERKIEELQVKQSNQLKDFANKQCTECQAWKSHQGKCYLFSAEKMTWTQSQNYCKSRGAHLVIINSQQEQDFIVSNIMETHWIGLSDLETEGRWLWVDNTPLSETKAKYWSHKQPDDWTGGGDPTGEDCASMGDHNGSLNFWFDASCAIKKKCVCEVN